MKWRGNFWRGNFWSGNFWRDDEGARRGDALLKEDYGFLLQETGFKILLDTPNFLVDENQRFFVDEFGKRMIG